MGCWLLAVSVVLALQLVPIADGLPAIWTLPTPTCDSFAIQTGVCCLQTQLPVFLGRSVNFTLQAVDVTPAATPRNATITLQSAGTGVQPAGPLPCCGFSNLLNTIQPSVTRLPVTWLPTAADFVTEDNIPTVYCLNFSATYNNLAINAACPKRICLKICAEPLFVRRDTLGVSSLLSTPTWGKSLLCGNDASCLRWAPEGSVGQKLLAYYQMSDQNTLVNVDDDSQIGVRVGQNIRFTVTVANLDNNGVVDILVVEDPGLPIGMSIVPSLTPCRSSEVCRDVIWIPRLGQEGVNHVVRFVARNVAGGVCPVVYSKELTVVIPVSRPKATWSQSPNFKERDVAVGGQYDQLLSCRSNNYVGKVSFVNMTIDDKPTGEGDMGGATLTLVQNQVKNTYGIEQTMLFSFTSSPSDAGTSKRWCFSCGDSLDVTPKSVDCLTVTTRLCEYAVSVGDTLHSLTRRHHLNTNWLRMWNANPSLTDPDTKLDQMNLLAHPDEQLVEGWSVRIGGVYTIKRGDTLNTVAARFETTVKKLLLVNPKLAQLANGLETTIQPGTDVCIMACTDKMPSRSSIFGWA